MRFRLLFLAMLLELFESCFFYSETKVALATTLAHTPETGSIRANAEKV